MIHFSLQYAHAVVHVEYYKVNVNNGVNSALEQIANAFRTGDLNAGHTPQAIKNAIPLTMNKLTAMGDIYASDASMDAAEDHLRRDIIDPSVALRTGEHQGEPATQMQIGHVLHIIFAFLKYPRDPREIKKDIGRCDCSVQSDP